MPTPPKAVDNMTKNLTAEERALREQAERGVIPDRGREVKLEKPAIMAKNAAAGRYWKKVLERMRGLVMLLSQVFKQLKEAADDPETVAEAVSKLDTVNGKMQSLERNILQYAEKLGLTPSGRIRLAQKRAEQAAVKDPDGDLFGD